MFKNKTYQRYGWASWTKTILEISVLVVYVVQTIMFSHLVLGFVSPQHKTRTSQSEFSLSTNQNKY